MDLTLESLQEAVAIRERIDALERQLASLFEAPREPAASPATGRKRTMSAAARKKIAEAQRARWAKQRPSADNAAKPQSRGRKRPPMSAEARTRLAAAAKKRWAAAKRAGRSRL